jgi:hypothetical protein
MLYEVDHAILPLWMGEVFTSRHVVVRRRHRDTLTLIHYHVTIGGLRKTHRTNIHDHGYHGNPLIVVYCGDLSCTVMRL